jgi:hypothetical protein
MSLLLHKVTRLFFLLFIVGFKGSKNGFSIVARDSHELCREYLSAGGHVTASVSNSTVALTRARARCPMLTKGSMFFL